MKILLRAPIGTTSGYGRDGVGIVRALLKREHEVDLYPEAVSPPLPQEVANLLTYPTSSGYDLEIHHVPPTGAQTGGYNKTRSKKVVLWTMWEWDTFPASVPNRNIAETYIKHYDHVVGYTQQTLDSMKEFLGEGQATSVVQGGFEKEPWYPAEGTAWEKHFPSRKHGQMPFRFAMVGHLAARKNPYTVLRAFNSLKEEMGDDFNAELLIKTGFPLVPPNYDAPGVKFIQEIGWSDELLRQFYWSIDCLVNCAWGEGKDLPPMEATMSGTPVLLNDNPGHRGWVHPGILPLVPSTTMEMGEGYVGRFTGVDDTKKAMLEVYNNKAMAYDRAKQLASYIEKRATWDYRIQKFGEAVGVNL